MTNPADFSLKMLNTYRENRHLEVKSAKGGLPASLWESYSAFANSDGGVIVLGAKERSDGSIFIEGLDNAPKLEKDFWNMINNRQKVSCNILTSNMAYIGQIEGKDVLVIKVPRAERTTKPVYVGTDPRFGSYRRNGEGDYHCTPDEVGLMLRDALLVSEDNKIIKGMTYSDLDHETIRSYRQIFRLTRANHVWNKDEDEVFLRRIGAMREDKETGKFHPTAAGLLMFGHEYDITCEFPQYFLDFQENRTDSVFHRWTDRVTSQTGDWSGNVFDYVLKVIPKLFADLKVPFMFKGIGREEMTPVHKAVREALINMMSNADFYGRRGVVVQKGETGFKFANPGSMRVTLQDALESNMSDPRNGTIHKMFAMLDYCERAGSGLQSIFRTWETVYKTHPVIETKSDGVDRTVLSLDFRGNEPDVKAMLSLYDNPEGLILKEGDTLNETLDVPQKGDDTLNEAMNVPQKDDDTLNKTLNVPQKDDDTPNETLNVPQNEFEYKNTKWDTIKKRMELSEIELTLIDSIANNVKISKATLAENLGVSKSTVLRMCRRIGIKWEGHSKTGHWAIGI